MPSLREAANIAVDIGLVTVFLIALAINDPKQFQLWSLPSLVCFLVLLLSMISIDSLAAKRTLRRAKEVL